ncbi:hypothetical protein KSS87_020996 [Heliosperma pusillum]|nr:hypothetical protein KSS87_020996 [Heliosperma pusillum]
MELNSTINDTWKLSILGSLIGCLIILLFLDQTNQNLSFSVVRNMTTLGLEPPSSMISNHNINPNITLNYTNLSSNYTTNVVEKPRMTLDLIENSASNTSILNHTLIGRVERFSKKAEKECNIFEGKWVYKAEEERRYDTSTCPFLEEKMSCQKNGRPDFEYEKWRWEANNCDIPLFNGTFMLERLKNKRVIIVGDSLNRNMWESLACLVYTSIPSSRVHVEAESSTYKVFKAMDYNCVIEFYWSPFLIEHNEQHETGKRVLVLDKLSQSSKRWQGADVMVFNSGHWWTHLGKLKAWDLFQYDGKLTEEMPIELAYERGMKTWAKWVEKNVNPEKTAVFFRSISPEHHREQWCYNVTQPTMDESYKSRYPDSLVNIVEGIIKGMRKLQVKYLNITKLSSYRRDAHPSVYRSLNWKIYTTKYKRLVQSYADCSHWCLPGLPDTWNRLLYTSLFFNSSGHMSTS